MAMGPISEECVCLNEGGFLLCANFDIPNPKLPYTISTDASGTGAGGALLQDQGEGLRPIAFLSRRLKLIE